MENKKLSRRDRVWQHLTELTQQMTVQRINRQDFFEHDAAGIGKSLNITMNNACMELNVLVKEGLAVKILGRPVYFFAKEELERATGAKMTQNIWDNYDQFKDAVNRRDEQYARRVYAPPAGPRRADVSCGKSFSHFVGAEQSLKKCIDQAKAAMLYPPKGLHTLIIGDTGTGKSYFAEAMYDFAVETGQIGPEAKFVIYNCASYSENPQLLLSQLFGYKKGAFTGADRDTPGVIDQANGGVLFLDEAHRLSPEGQEKMFLLIDKGIFQRLGETKEYRQAKVRIVAATTEEPNTALLSTFLRRIAVVISLPPLDKRSFDERLNFVFHFLWTEARTIGLPLCVDREVIQALVMYKCRGNIGQLRADIQCLCSSAYLDYYAYNNRRDGEPGVSVGLVHLPNSVEMGLGDASFSSGGLFRRYAFYKDPYTVVDPNSEGYGPLAKMIRD